MRNCFRQHGCKDFIIFLLSMLCFNNVPNLSASTGEQIPFSKLYDSTLKDFSVWKNEDGISKMSFTSFEGMATLRCIDTNKSWGGMYRTVTVDLDLHPILQINIHSVSKQWFMLLEGKQFSNEYVRLIQSNDTGTFNFDIPKLTGIKGKQKFVFKIGVSSEGELPVTNEKVSFDKLIFVSSGPVKSPDPSKKKKTMAVPKKEPQDSGSIYVFDSLGKDVDLWGEFLKGGPLEVRYTVNDGMGLVRGKINSRNWGSVHRQITIDVSQYPVLEFNVKDCSKLWYLILTSPNLPQGYKRLDETVKTGLFKYDIQKITGMSGRQSFDLQVGVSNPEGTSIKGEWVSFDLLRFTRR